MQSDLGQYNFDDFKKKLEEKIKSKIGKNDTAYSRYVVGGYIDGKKTKVSSSFEDYIKIDADFPKSISLELTNRLKEKLDKLPSAWYSFNFEFYGQDGYCGFHWIGDMKDNLISVAGVVEA